MAHPILPTTLVRESRLSRRLHDAHGIDLTIVSEAFQRTGSFKFRAAWQLASLAAEPHLIAASSGNFGQALACACQMLGKRCTIVMPDDSATVKVEAVRAYGAIADLVDVRSTTRASRVAALAQEHPEARVASAYDDDDVIDGNATLGRELVELGFDIVLAPVGGGGLTSGLVVGLTGCGTSVWGAEPLMANDAAQSLREGRIVKHDTEPKSIADGARTISLGERNFAILRSGLAGIVETPEEAIIAGLRALFLEANLKAEPTGALAIGALLFDPEPFAGQRVAVVVSGGNVDPALYARLLSE